MDIQTKVEEFLLEWKNVNSDNVIEKTMEKVSSFKKQKNAILFLKLLIIKLRKQANHLIADYDELSYTTKARRTQKFRKEVKKIACIREIYEEYKSNYVEEKTIVPEQKAKVAITTWDSFSNTNEEENIIDDINFEEYDLPKSVSVFSQFIKSCNPIEDKEKILEYTDYLCDTLVEYLYDNYEVFVEFDHLLDALKYKAIQYKKESNERQIIKDVQKRFKNIYKVYNNSYEVSNNNETYFQIIDYYLEKENYFSIQELLKRKPDMCNLTNEDGHIAIYILTKYIENFKKMTENKNSKHININYLREIYEMFTKSPSLRIKYDDKEKIDSTINEFYAYIRATIIKRSRKNRALEEAKSMKSSNFYLANQIYDKRVFTDDNLTYEKQRIINLLKDYSERFEETENAFVIGDVAYSLYRDEADSYILKVHALDPTDFIVRDSMMNSYLKQCELEHEDIDDFVLRGFRFEKDKKYPVMTYTLEFLPSGTFKNMNVTKNFINITNVYNTMYNKNEEQTEFFELYKKSVAKNGGNFTTEDTYKMNEHFEDVLTPAYVDFVKTHLIPFIYYGYKKQTEFELEDSRNFLATKLSGLNKADMNELLNILTSRVDKFHYSKNEIENPVYKLSLVHSFNFLGLENQRTLNDIYFNRRKIEDPKQKLIERRKYYQRNDEIIELLNKSINYVDMSEVKQYRSKKIVRGNFY